MSCVLVAENFIRHRLRAVSPQGSPHRPRAQGAKADIRPDRLAPEPLVILANVDGIDPDKF